MVPDDSLPTVLRDLAATLEAELMADAAATAEISPDVVREFQGLRLLQGLQTVSGKTPATSATSATPATPATSATLATLKEIAAAISSCTSCPLAKTRHNVVPGVGKVEPDVMFIGEGPGADEDAQGLPFVGRAGELLTKMIAAMGYSRDQVFIANVVKCRPPDNRKPLPEEMAACMPYLRRQVELVKPKTIVALGATAVQGLFNTTRGINALRGHWMDFQGIPVMPTFHPAYLLRMPVAKRDAWSDLKQVMAKLAESAGATRP